MSHRAGSRITSTASRGTPTKIADDKSLSYAEKLAGYRKLADDYFEIDRYREFCAKHLSTVDEVVYDWVVSDEFKSLLRETVRAMYPVHEHEKFLAHFGGLIDAWIRDQGR